MTIRRRDCFDSPLHVGQLNLPSPGEFREAFDGIFSRRFFANHGPLEQELDAALAEYFGVRHAVSVVNGTTALMLMLRALDLEGDVITPSFTFPAAVEAIVWAGLKPVFCDVDPETQMLTVPLLEKAVTRSTTAILGFHAWGRACDPMQLADLAHHQHLKLVFDAAHATGCAHDGKRVGGFGHAEAFSFHATKVLNGMEGGCVTTNDGQLAERIRAMRSFHGTPCVAAAAPRMNAKISEAQAAMALLGLRKLDRLVERNRNRYELYRLGLQDIPGVQFLDYAAGQQSNYQSVVALVSSETFGMTRDGLLDVLRSKQVLGRRYFFPGVHRLEPFFDPAIRLPITEFLCHNVFQLPNGEAVTDDDIRLITAIIRAAGAR